MGCVCCKGSRMHQTACFGLPQWCDQQFVNHSQFCFSRSSIHLFATHGKCISGFLLVGVQRVLRTLAATAQGNIFGKCDVAQTDSPTQHTKCMTRTQREARSTEKVLHQNNIAPKPAPTRSSSRALHPSLVPSVQKSCLCVCVSVSL